MNKKMIFIIIGILISYTIIDAIAIGNNHEISKISSLIPEDSYQLDILNKTLSNEEFPLSTAHPPIRIIGEDDFSSENGVTRGDGTKDNPYIIELLRIEATSFWLHLNTFLNWIEQSDLDNKMEYFVNIPICGIYLKDTAKHVIIRNNHLRNWNGESRELIQIAGITLVNASNVTIEKNIFENNYRGVNFENVQRVTKEINNSVHTFHEEYDSVFCTIKNNTFITNDNEGLFLQFLTHSEIIGNDFSGNGCGIRSNVCKVIINNNSFYSNGNGFISTQYDFSTIKYNTFISNGNAIYCSESSSSNPIGSNPLIAYNYFEGNSAGVFITTNYPNIENNTFYKNNYGIMNMGASRLPIRIVDNNISENKWMAISFRGACIIDHNRIVSNGEGGISITGNVTITNNIIALNHGHGLSISSDDRYPAVHYNNIFNNTGKGINCKPSSDLPTNATMNYWGSPDGPGGYGSGNGDEIDEFILYDPWLSEMNYQAGPR
jgi:parallel beta-helix repeat protein